MNNSFKNISNLVNKSKYIFVLDSKIYELFGVILLAISGNFIYNVVTKENPNIKYHFFGCNPTSYVYNLMFGLGFILLGAFFIYYSYSLAKIEKDSIKFPISISQKEWIFYRIIILNKVLFVAANFAILFLIFIFFSSQKKNVNKLKQIPIYNQPIDLHLQDEYSLANQYAQHQLDVIKYLINTHKLNLDTLSILDAASGTGNLVSLVKDSLPDIFILGSDGDLNMIKYSKQKLSPKKYNQFIISKPVLWQELSENDIINARKWDFVCLLGNSIPFIENQDDLKKVFIECRKILKKGGYLLVDFNNLKDKDEPKQICQINKTGYYLYEEFIDDNGPFIKQKLYHSNTKKSNNEFPINLLRYCLEKENVVNDLIISNFKIVKVDSISKVYNCKDLEIIVAQK